MSVDVVIGLEIHAQLLTRSKAFCGCAVDEEAAPNTRCCPVCLGHPGAMPVLNAALPQAAVMLGSALQCDIRSTSTFSRKHYFYPDLVKGYQITQYRDPICANGAMSYINASGEADNVRLTRIHMEEDAAKMKHTEDGSLVDYNRAGTPLLEIVTAPDFDNPADAAAFMKSLRQLLRWLNLSDGDMERGSLRCDANISLRNADGSAGERTEIKNLNSFRSVERALAWEILRQRRMQESGGTIEAATLLWDEDAQEARIMRGKESAAEYHYLPEPDLPPVLVTSEMLQSARDTLPELPFERWSRYVEDFGLSPQAATTLTNEKTFSFYYEQLIKRLPIENAPVIAAKWMTGEVLRDMHTFGDTTPCTSATSLARLIMRVEDGTISYSAAKEVLPALRTGEDVDALIDNMELRQLHNPTLLHQYIVEILDDFPDQLAKYCEGKQQLFGFFMGQLMQRTDGRAEPITSKSLLTELLTERCARGAS
ncbi:Asp-tRNA(Asn)/Glu-tRNA(Gln) amidotransferase subunit GatB [bacterium]|nr:Asp-tRNA(Asn)/Glu-tRNA(Gln) amidotransferase subunit GatB [bacterium]